MWYRCKAICLLTSHLHVILVDFALGVWPNNFIRCVCVCFFFTVSIKNFTFGPFFLLLFQFLCSFRKIRNRKPIYAHEFKKKNRFVEKSKIYKIKCLKLESQLYNQKIGKWKKDCAYLLKNLSKTQKKYQTNVFLIICFNMEILGYEC